MDGWIDRWIDARIDVCIVCTDRRSFSALPWMLVYDSNLIVRTIRLYVLYDCTYIGGDGPSKTILSYMGNQGFVAPSSWKGFRPLTSK